MEGPVNPIVQQLCETIAMYEHRINAPVPNPLIPKDLWGDYTRLQWRNHLSILIDVTRAIMWERQHEAK